MRAGESPICPGADVGAPYPMHRAPTSRWPRYEQTESSFSWYSLAFMSKFVTICRPSDRRPETFGRAGRRERARPAHPHLRRAVAHSRPHLPWDWAHPCPHLPSDLGSPLTSAFGLGLTPAHMCSASRLAPAHIGARTAQANWAGPARCSQCSGVLRVLHGVLSGVLYYGTGPAPARCSR